MPEDLAHLTNVDYSIRETFPKDLFQQLKELGGGLSWSADKPNLLAIKEYLNNPDAVVLYVGSNSDRSTKKFF